MENYLDFGGIRDRQTIAILDGYFKERRDEYSGGNLIYRGVHFEQQAETSRTDWEIWKYTYTDSGVHRQGPLRGSWDGRSTLGWSNDSSKITQTSIDNTFVARTLIEDVLMQLKIMNTHLSLITDHEIKFDEL